MRWQPQPGKNPRSRKAILARSPLLRSALQPLTTQTKTAPSQRDQPANWTDACPSIHQSPPRRHDLLLLDARRHRQLAARPLADAATHVRDLAVSRLPQKIKSLEAAALEAVARAALVDQAAAVLAQEDDLLACSARGALLYYVRNECSSRVRVTPRSPCERFRWRALPGTPRHVAQQLVSRRQARSVRRTSPCGVSHGVNRRLPER